MSIQITEVKFISRLYSIIIETNSDLISISFSTIIFSKTALGQQNNFVLQDFTILNGN